MGASAYVQKPFDTDDILRLVTSFIERTTLTFWGVRGSCAAPGPETARYGGNTPCVTIEHDGHILILDAGTGIRKLGLHLMAAAAGRPLSLDLLVSHTHWDHIQGFPFFVPAYIPGNRLNVYGPRSAEKPLEKVLRGQMDVEYFPVALGDLAAQLAFTEYRGQPWQVGPFHVRPGYLNHPGLTLGFRIEVGGLCITYATDTEPFRTLLPMSPSAHRDSGAFGRTQDQALVELVRGADVYIADAQYTPEEYKKKTGWGHTNYADAVETAIEAGAKHLVLFSHDPMHDDAEVDHKLSECRAMIARRGVPLTVSAASEMVPLHLPTPAPAAATPKSA
ncbi:MAG: MBL fold metallo-hydrolase [Myxococcales bacterium]|nr:MBL fold metallo-hydrolase [Myxococcales bacterium]